MLIKDEFQIEKGPLSRYPNINLNNISLEKIIDKIESIPLFNESLKINKQNSYFKTNKKQNLTNKVRGNLKYFCLKSYDDLYFLEINCKHYESNDNNSSDYISCKMSLHIDKLFSAKKKEYLSLMSYFYKLKSLITKSYNPLSKKKYNEVKKIYRDVFGK